MPLLGTCHFVTGMQEIFRNFIIFGALRGRNSISTTPASQIYVTNTQPHGTFNYSKQDL